VKLAVAASSLVASGSFKLRSSCPSRKEVVTYPLYSSGEQRNRFHLPTMGPGSSNPWSVLLSYLGC